MRAFNSRKCWCCRLTSKLTHKIKELKKEKKLFNTDANKKLILIEFKNYLLEKQLTA